jgi:CDGSH-type Zn-finger protein
MPDPLPIRCRENGPLVVPAALVKVFDHLGNEIPLPQGKEMIALCRCGQSKNKPFCDGMHKQVGFVAGAPAAAPPAPPA